MMDRTDHPYTDEELANWRTATWNRRWIATIDARDAAHRQEIAERDARIAELSARRHHLADALVYLSDPARYDKTVTEYAHATLQSEPDLHYAPIQRPYDPRTESRNRR